MKLRLMFVALLAGLLVACTGPKQIDPSKESINMLQPCRWYQLGCNNARNAQKVNVPNSQANQNNAEANRANAQAELIKEQAEQIYLENQVKQTKIDLVRLALLCTAGFIVILIVLIGMVIAGRANSQQGQTSQ